MNKILPALENILNFAPAALAFVLPLFFLPLTTEYFETAKIALLIIAAALLFVVWGLKMVAEKKVSFIKSPFDLALALMLVIFAFASFLAPNILLSFTGSYLRFQPSLTFYLAIVVLYYIFAANLKDGLARRLAVISLVFSVSLSALVSLVAYSGALSLVGFLPDYLKSPVFNTAGSLTSFSILAALALVLALGLLAEGDDPYKGYKSYNNYKSYIRGALTLALYPLIAIIIAYHSAAGILAALVGVGLLLILQPGALLKLKSQLLPAAVWAILSALVFLTPIGTKTLKLTAIGSEVNLGLSNSWVVASQVIIGRPLLGTGFGSFPLDFTAFRPLTLNSGNYWNLRFDEPFNEVLLILSDAGILGALAFLFVLLRLVLFVLGLKNKDGFSQGLGAAGITLAVVAFVAAYSSLESFVLILLMALLVSHEEAAGSKSSEKVVVMVSAIRDRIIGKAVLPRTSPTNEHELPGFEKASRANQILPYAVLGLSVIAAALAVPATALAYAAEYYNLQAIKAVAQNDGRGAYANEARALSLNPYFDAYSRNLAQIALGVAANLSSRQNLTDADRQTIQSLIQEAINRVRIATEVLAPSNVANWETRAQVYQNLINVAQNADSWTVDAYSQAIVLDPSNPNLRILLGGVYFGLGKYDLAANSFAQAANLKPDLANAHYNLAQALLKLKQDSSALNEYDTVLNLIGTGSQQYDQVKKERDDLAKKVAAETPSTSSAGSAGSQATTPSAGTAGQQEPLKVNTPETSLQKSNVTPPINLPKSPAEASPSSVR